MPRRESVAAEIDAAEAIFCHHFGDRVRMNLNMALTDMLPEMIAVFKMAIIGIKGFD